MNADSGKSKNSADHTAGAIIEAMENPVFLLSAGGAILSANSRATELTGCRHSELIGKQISDIAASRFQTGNFEATKQRFQDFIEGRSTRPPQLVRVENNRKIKVQPQISFLKVAGKDTGKALLTLGDSVTDNNLSNEERDIAYDRELLQAVFDTVPVLLVVWNARMNSFKLNRRAEEVLGWTTAEANEGDFMSKVYPDREYRKEVAEFMQSLDSEWRELTTTAKNGEPIPCNWANARLADDTMIGIGIDLREIKLVEDALHRSEKRLKQAMIAGQVYTFDWDTVSDEVSRSENCPAILHENSATCHRTAGKEHISRIVSEDQDAFNQVLNSLSPENPEYETEYRYMRPDGKIIWLEESGCGYFDENRRLLRVQGIVADVTARKELEEQEKTTVAAQSAINTVNAMAEGVVLLDLDGTVETLNPAAEKMTGLKKNEAIGHNIRNLIPRVMDGNELEAAMRAVEQIQTGLRPEARHIVIQPLNSNPISVSPSVRFIKPTDNTSAKAVLTLKDVTSLHNTNELLKQIFDNTHMHIAYLDTSFNFRRVNRTYARGLGHSPQYFQGKNHFELFPDEGNEAIFRKVRDTGKPYTVYEKPFIHAGGGDNEISYWDWSLRPVESSCGNTAGLLLCLVDSTERVRTRRQLIKSEREYRELVHSANSIIMRITPDHTITFFNEYAQRFFGYTSNEILGRNVLGTITPDIDSEGRDLRKMLQKITANPELFRSNENEGIRKDGSRAWIHWSNRAIRDGRGNVIEILCVGNDVTRRKRLEQRARNYQRRLRGLADRLIQTEEQERRRVATQIHDTVIQTLSLSNVRLGGIRSQLEAEGIEKQSKRIDGIRSLLSEGIQECRTLMGRLVPSLLYELGLAPALRNLAEKQHELDGTPIHVLEEGNIEPLNDAVKGLLFQCARELVMNALKYAGPCEISIFLVRNEEGIELAVSDTGNGFDPSTLYNHIADHEKQGGFGLFSIRERLEGLGGELIIDSEPAHGTTAKVRLPAEKLE
ncbi:MAG: PAS domain S-box protein [Verrucomicrobiota bacterium]